MQERVLLIGATGLAPAGERRKGPPEPYQMALAPQTRSLKGYGSPDDRVLGAHG